jgi:hypothetical protein
LIYNCNFRRKRNELSEKLKIIIVGYIIKK